MVKAIKDFKIEIDKEKVRDWLTERYRQLLLANRAMAKKTEEYTQDEVLEYQHRTVRMLELFAIIRWLDKQEGVRDGQLERSSSRYSLRR